MLDGEHAARAPEPALHFVGDKQNAVPIQNVLHAREVAGRGDDDAALAQHRLGDEGRHVGAGLIEDRILDGVGAGEGA